MCAVVSVLHAADVSSLNSGRDTGAARHALLYAAAQPANLDVGLADCCVIPSAATRHLVCGLLLLARRRSARIERVGRARRAGRRDRAMPGFCIIGACVPGPALAGAWPSELFLGRQSGAQTSAADRVPCLNSLALTPAPEVHARWRRETSSTHHPPPQKSANGGATHRVVGTDSPQSWQTADLDLNRGSSRVSRRCPLHRARDSRALHRKVRDPRGSTTFATWDHPHGKMIAMCGVFGIPGHDERPTSRICMHALRTAGRICGAGAADEAASAPRRHGAW